MKYIVVCFSLLFMALGAKAQDLVAHPEEYVNPLVGTDSKFSLSNGNTYPAIAVPWGMNFWSPQTGKMGDGWMYTYGADKIRGFKQTHQPSPWINDYGQFSLMPGIGEPQFDQEERASWFSHKTEHARPYHYEVYLADCDTKVELAPTDRAAAFRFHFPDYDSSYVLVDAFDKESYLKVLPSEHKLIGYSTKNSGGVPDNFKNYFELSFDKEIDRVVFWNDGKVVSDIEELKGKHVMAAVYFKKSAETVVNARVASSFISHEQASLNMKEIEHKSLEEVAQYAKAAWNKELGRIKVGGGTEEQLKTFYSCLYRSLLFPRKFYEVDAQGNIVHYSPYNGQVLPGYMFTDTGFWDTFRALFPFLNLMYPTLNGQIMQGLENTYKESGWLPEWASPGHRESMIGSNSASIVADAYVKGIEGFDPALLYEAMVKNTRQSGPVSSVGRFGVDYYNDLGYIPQDAHIKGNVARSLEYAYADFAVYQLAMALGRPQEEIDLYKNRSFNYKKLFDSEYGLMNSRYANGEFFRPFDPYDWNYSFTEGNSWHWSWAVFHDIAGLKELMGGDKAFVDKLDSIFILPPKVGWGPRKGPIHEMTEMQVAGMGQYAHGNQPIQHMIYLYNHAGAPWKTQYWVRESMNRLYNAQPDGYCGDEDNGQTSAWYVFSALGFYPVTPGTDQYVLGAPLFKKAVLSLENGNQIVIEAPNNSEKNSYIHELKWNGKAYGKNWLSHSELLKGAVLEFDMRDSTNTKRGTDRMDFPFSLSSSVH
ncbi:GH92 family glycosyl hydrolase [Olivibacter sitiensis]|uniref:GH92 family glycosyl hydrolase n=1 Tax=Olivibacter sitiensis TaxID=376470 RepID=UPI0004036C92|nr:GH92 family glycosyl hydrolase [Olivibacter sitiensis]